MATSKTLGGQSFSIPANSETGWGNEVTNYLIQIADKCVATDGGTRTLLAELNLGSTYGVKAAYIKSQAANPAAAGIVRLGNTEAISWRNAANGADKALKVNASDLLEYDGAALLTTSHSTDTSVHGVSGDVVGTTDTQTLTNKTLTAPTINGGTANNLTALSVTDGTAKLSIEALMTSAVDRILTISLTGGEDQTLNIGSDFAVSGDSVTLNSAGTSSLTIPTGSHTAVTLSSAQTLISKTLTSPVINTGISGTAIKDEDDMSSDSATHLATQQSIKAYVDAVAATKQGLDSDLTAIAGLASNGLIARTDTGAVSVRTITAGSDKLTVTDGDGVSGDPTVDVAEANLTLDNIGGTLGIAKGGTGETTATAAFDGLSPTTTKGDLIVSDGTNNVRLAAGSDGQVLTADSGEDSGLGWSSPLTNPMTAANDIIVGGSAGAANRVDTDLLGNVNASINSFTFATSDVTAAADTITKTSHGLSSGMPCYLTSSGTLPAGLTASTKYYVIVDDANTIRLATKYVDAIATTPIDIDITDQGSGTHTLIYGGLTLPFGATDLFEFGTLTGGSGTGSVPVSSGVGVTLTSAAVVCHYLRVGPMVVVNAIVSNLTGSAAAGGRVEFVIDWANLPGMANGIFVRGTAGHNYHDGTAADRRGYGGALVAVSAGSTTSIVRYETGGGTDSGGSSVYISAMYHIAS